MDKKRLQELAGIQLNEYGSVTSPYSSEKYGTEENEYEELPVTSKTGYEDTFKNEENEYEEAEEGSIFGTMTREEFKGIGKSLGLAWDRAVGDLRRSGEERPKEKAFDLVSRQCDDALRKLEQEAKDD